VLPAIGIAGALLERYVTVMWFTVWSFQVATEDAYVQADIAAIATKLAGYVASIQVPDNQTVKSGDVLLTLDTDDIRPRLD
jgi:membrane fusion protein (multidrug efflux system)